MGHSYSQCHLLLWKLHVWTPFSCSYVLQLRFLFREGGCCIRKHSEKAMLEVLCWTVTKVESQLMEPMLMLADKNLHQHRWLKWNVVRAAFHSGFWYYYHHNLPKAISWLLTALLPHCSCRTIHGCLMTRVNSILCCYTWTHSDHLPKQGQGISLGNIITKEGRKDSIKFRTVGLFMKKSSPSYLWWPSP